MNESESLAIAAAACAFLIGLTALPWENFSKEQYIDELGALEKKQSELSSQISSLTQARRTSRLGTPWIRLRFSRKDPQKSTIRRLVDESEKTKARYEKCISMQRKIVLWSSILVALVSLILVFSWMVIASLVNLSWIWIQGLQLITMTTAFIVAMRITLPFCYQAKRGIWVARLIPQSYAALFFAITFNPAVHVTTHAYMTGKLPTAFLPI